MKFTSKISAALVSVGLFAAASAEEPVKFSVPGVTTPATPAAAPAAPATKFTEAQVLEAYGWYTGMRMGLSQLGFTKEQVEVMSRGLVASTSGTPPPFDMKAIGPEMEAFLGKKNEAYLIRLRMENLSQGATFFTKLKENKNVVALESGLYYEITKPGTGALPKIGQTVTIHYTGSLTTGQVFDTSLQPRQQGGTVEPVEMVLQSGQLIPGMVEGLQKIPVGGKGKLYIPPSLAYGDEGSQAIPPGATLIFEVEVLAAKDTPAPSPAPAGK
jgi:FKBP-type peptidyl-prolyl cis-trans isomerase